MAGFSLASQVPPGEDALVRKIADLQRELRELGPSVASSFRTTVEELRAVDAQLNATLVDIQATVATAITDSSYTRATIDERIANPVDVTATGRVTSALPLTSLGSRNYLVTTSFVGAWINEDGQIGYNPSSRTVKRDLEPFTGAESLLGLNVYRGRYNWDADDAPLQSFLIAEEVINHFPDMVPCDAEGTPQTVNYSQLTVPIIALLQQQNARVVALEARLAAVEAAATP